MKNELLDELSKCIERIECLAMTPYKDTEDYENLDKARNRAYEIIEILRKNH